MAPNTRSKRRRNCPPAIPDTPPRPGYSIIERLPIEILHLIHFQCPGRLPECSKTLLCYFSAPNLPIYPTIRHLVSLPSFHAQLSNADRTIWFLQRAYVRTEEFVATFVREVYLAPGAPYEDELLSQPFFDPSHFFLADPTTLPSELVHFIYHTYPTDSYKLAEAAVTDLSEGRAERAEQLLAVGAIPSLAPAKLKDAAAHAEIKNVPGVSTRYPSERMMAWKNRDVERRVCVCGFDTGAAAMRMYTDIAPGDGAGVGNGRLPAQALALLQPKIRDPNVQLGPEWNGILPLVEHRDRRPFFEIFEDSERVMDRISFGPCRIMKYWMLPFNGTVGKYPHPLTEAEKAFEGMANRCQHEESLTREFLVGYILELRRCLL